MPTTTDPRAVPLNVWLTDPHADNDVRRQLADRLISTYTSPGGIVLDLAPDRGDVLAAAAHAGRGAIVCAVLPTCARRQRVPALDALTGAVDLAVALPARRDLDPPRPRSLSGAAAARLCGFALPLLRPGGYLVLGALGAPSPDPDPVSAMVAVASDAGLRYDQHLVALPGVDPSFVPSAPDGGRRLAHADLLVFTKAAR